MKKLTFFLLSFLIIAFFFTYFAFLKRTKGFCLKKISSHHSYHPHWDTGPLTQVQQQILDQLTSNPCTYLSSGKECYVFESHDKKLVIKFFKQNHMKTKSFLTPIENFLPPFLKIREQEKRWRHTYLRHKTFSSYWIAYHHLFDKTGVVYLHLNPTSYLNKNIKLILPNGQEKTLSLDTFEFLLQKRAQSVFDHLHAFLEKHEIQKAKEGICSILDLIIDLKIRGIENDDGNCRANLGFIDNQAILIDIGELHLRPPTYPKLEEFKRVTSDLSEFLQQNCPELLPFLKQQIDLRFRKKELKSNFFCF